MHCFICVTYLMIIATAHPPKVREVSRSLEKRSIFTDVIQSLRIRSQLPEDINLNDENNIGQNYGRYGFDNEPMQLPSDIDFMPRRNDRIEMPTLKYRFPKSLMKNDSSTNIEKPKEEIIIYVNTPSDNEVPTTTQNPKKQKPKPVKNKSGNKNEEDNAGTSDRPLMNTMSGQSQIGNRESQTVVKPTVIVNFRGSVMHRESDIRLQTRKEDNDTVIPQNIFNINQEIKLQRNDYIPIGNLKNVPVKVKQDVKVIPDKGDIRYEEDMMMCETSSTKEKEGKYRTSRDHDNIVQIVVSV